MAEVPPTSDEIRSWSVIGGTAVNTFRHRFFCCADFTDFGKQRSVTILVSSPGEFHPEALVEPDVNVSVHPAPIIQPQTNGFVLAMSSSPFGLTQS